MKGIILCRRKRHQAISDHKGCLKAASSIYDKPLIYYPLSVLMLAGIKKILIISTSEDIPSYRRLLGDGTQLGLSFTYCNRKRPGDRRGICSRC